MSKIAVIGAGGWGTAMANVLSKKNKDISIWCYEKEVADEINDNNTNNRYLYGVWLNKNLKASNNLEEVIKGAEYVFYVTPSFILEKIVKESKNYLSKNTIPVFLTKGFIETGNTPELPLDTAKRLFSKEIGKKSVFLTGPSHAEEVARNIYTGLIVASSNKKNAVKVRDIVSSEYLSVFVSFDPIGVQVSAGLKNVIAISFGIADAMRDYDKNIGDNTFAMLISAGLNEIQRVATAMGSTHPETFTSYSSVGDLYVTCTSHHGRNRRFGKDLIERQLYRQWNSFDELLEKINIIVGYIPEGIFAVKPAMKIKKYYKLTLPTIEIAYKMLNREIKPNQVIQMLMSNFNKD